MPIFGCFARESTDSDGHTGWTCGSVSLRSCQDATVVVLLRTAVGTPLPHAPKVLNTRFDSHARIVTCVLVPLKITSNLLVKTPSGKPLSQCPNIYIRTEYF
jgi:hypothetical protein